eukprot:RCo015331
MSGSESPPGMAISPEHAGSCSALKPTLVHPVSSQPSEQPSPSTASPSYSRACTYQLPESNSYLTPSRRGPSYRREVTQRSAVFGDSLLEDSKPTRRAPSLPLRLVFVVVLCLFAVGPAVALWIISWRSGQDALN